MQYIIFSLLCSVSVGVLLKFSKNCAVSSMQMINWNYLYAALLSYYLFKPKVTALPLGQLPWPLIAMLCLVLPSLFLIQALSLQHVGVAKTDVAQRLSLFVALIAAFLLFKEPLNLYKIIGSCLALVAVVLTLHRQSTKSVSSGKLLYPLIVLLGFALVDILFKLVATQKLLNFTSLLFLVFCGAFVVALIINLCLALGGKQRFDWRACFWGLMLGLLNFGNIYFYIKAHQAIPGNPSIVFATMNIGVVVLGCFAGVLLFNEKLSKINYIGVGLAILAVLVMTLNMLLK